MVFYCMISLLKDKVMKKIITILTIVPLMVFAGLNVGKVTNTLSHIKGKKTLSFFNANTHIPLEGKLKLTSLSTADIVLFSSKKHKSKSTIVNSYKKLKENKNSIGAIYLKKGRTQIIFVKERLDAKGLSLSPKFKKHILHEWQLDPLALVKGLK
ncbi:MAG: Unknown protein [uncultured Sulfurovum sp.]|uniref:Uncharacterized protein n=1 Tax=uncultured Sulfurovum sp. TaxID=269237 RepID=A0A6S6S1P7_9BACT|nr:MAG: Unknown protein [uncultured Sulfurovum sp.]